MLVRSAMDARLAGGVFLVVPADPTSSAHRRSRAAGPGTGTRAARASAAPVGGPGACRAASAGPGPLRSEIRGRRASSLPDTGGDLWSASATDPAGPGRRRRVDLCLPGGSARCSRSSRRWVEARCVQRRSRSAAGGTPSEGSQVVRVQGGEELGEPSRRSRFPGEGGGPVTAGSMRWGTASSGWLPWSRCVQPGGRGARLGRWPGRSPGSARRRVPPRPGQSRRCREGPCRPVEDRRGRCGQPVG